MLHYDKPGEPHNRFPHRQCQRGLQLLMAMADQSGAATDGRVLEYEHNFHKRRL